MQFIETPAYRKAFVQYLRCGIPIDISLKAMGDERPTTHYIWRTIGDDKVRSSHAANNGKIFVWSQPPETGHPGEEYGCRCWAESYYGLVEVNLPDDPPLESVYPELVFLPLLRFARILTTLLRRVRNIDVDTLNEVQARNLRRFDQKLPKDASEIHVIRGKGGQRIFRADVPARNIPGSYARYEKVVDKLGNTISYTKTTYAPDGSIVHIKIK
jgi:hypothetical protein